MLPLSPPPTSWVISGKCSPPFHPWKGQVWLLPLSCGSGETHLVRGSYLCPCVSAGLCLWGVCAVSCNYLFPRLPWEFGAAELWHGWQVRTDS